MLRNRTIAVLATIAATTAATLGVVAPPAEAAPGYVGRVDADRGLVAHFVPTTAAPRYGSYPDGARLRLVCKVHSMSVGGNDVWYLVRGTHRRWVSARYVENVGAAPRLCGDGRVSRARVVTERLNRREAPSVRAATDGTLSRHDRVSIVCWIDGLGERGGDGQWYQLAGGSWVSAQYVSATTRRVELCA